MTSKIIVGIDFSESSITALRLAIDVANRANSDLIMAWVKTREMSLEEGEEGLKELVKEYNESLRETDLAYRVLEGRVYQALSQLAKDETPDLIVIGAHGTGGFDEKYAGQNSYKIAAEINYPVLTVRHTFNFDKDLEKIILPIDSTRETRQKVPWTIEFAKIFPRSTIHVLGVQTSNVKSVRNDVASYVKSVEDFLMKNNMRYSSNFVDADNVTTATIDYAKSVDADIIVIMTEQEKTISNFFFLGPYAQQMLNLSPFPVLTVPPTQLHGSSR